MTDQRNGTALTMLRRPKVRLETGLSDSSLYDHIGRGLFTAPVKIGARSSAWPACEVEAINAARIAGKSADDVRKLVAKLHVNRLVLARTVPLEQ